MPHLEARISYVNKKFKQINMLKPITIKDLIKEFMRSGADMDDIVILASDEEGNSYGHMQPKIYTAEMKDGRHAVILFPYADRQYEDYFKTEDYLPGYLCPKCNGPVYASKNNETYFAECPNCDEDFFSIELKKINNK
ncbi:MAG: hypothetical protein PHY08_10085 [Candidatus Cloacimonetes bacterium]|nr:hypothetical protein [Candidatus Cloacimonadota bacterium]